MIIKNYTMQQINDLLENTVPTQKYVQLIKSLKRCQELLGQAAAHVEDADFKKELQIYAGSLDLFFDDLGNYPRAYVDITEGYDPVAHLRKLGVIPDEPNRAAFVREDMVKVREKLKKTRPAKRKGSRK